MKLFKGGKSFCYVMLIVVILICAMLSAQSFTLEGAVGSSYTAGTAVGGTPLTSGVDLGQIAQMDTVACAGMWATMKASGNGYTMVNALQEPDGTCIVDFMDNDGLYYTQTFSSKSNGAGGAAPGSAATPTPAANNQYNENAVSRNVVYN